MTCCVICRGLKTIAEAKHTDLLCPKHLIALEKRSGFLYGYVRL